MLFPYVLLVTHKELILSQPDSVLTHAVTKVRILAFAFPLHPSSGTTVYQMPSLCQVFSPCYYLTTIIEAIEGKG